MSVSNEPAPGTAANVSATTTRRGLRVKAVLDKRWYETGVKISDQQMKELNIRPHSQNPEWNYSILPRGN